MVIKAFWMNTDCSHKLAPSLSPPGNFGKDRSSLFVPPLLGGSSELCFVFNSIQFKVNLSKICFVYKYGQAIALSVGWRSGQVTVENPCHWIWKSWSQLFKVTRQAWKVRCVPWMTWKQRKLVQIQGHYSVCPVYTWVMNQCLVSLCKKGDTHTCNKEFSEQTWVFAKQRVEWRKKRDGSVWCGLLRQRWFLPHFEFSRQKSSVF